MPDELTLFNSDDDGFAMYAGYANGVLYWRLQYFASEVGQGKLLCPDRQWVENETIKGFLHSLTELFRRIFAHEPTAVSFLP